MCWKRTREARKRPIVDWGFNAWGGKYPPYDDDDAVPTRIAEELKLPVFYPEDRHGRRRGRLQRRRHGADDHRLPAEQEPQPELSKKQIEQYLKDYYGQRHVCWLGDGIDGDDTDGHIDDLARFINPTHDRHRASRTTRRTRTTRSSRTTASSSTSCATRTAGRSRSSRSRCPASVEHDGQRLPATYVNFYFVNGALLVPTYRHRKNDRRALEILQQHLPKHKVIGIDCIELIWGLGAIHCLTQQQPRVLSDRRATAGSISLKRSKFVTRVLTWRTDTYRIYATRPTRASRTRDKRRWS